MKTNDETQSPKYVTVREVASDPAFCFTVPMMRYYILNAHRNGLKAAIRRIGKKVLIRRDLFIQWIEEQGRKK